MGYLKPSKRAAKAAGRVKDYDTNLAKKGPGYTKTGSQKKKHFYQKKYLYSFIFLLRKRTASFNKLYIN
jgi:hypothetical protein